MKRREFITLVGAGAAAWPLAARAQQGERMRRIGVLMSLAASDPDAQSRFMAFRQELDKLGWTDSRNLRIDSRWAAGNADELRAYATELIDATPDVIVAGNNSALIALLQETRIPIVFVQSAGDPVQDGIVASLARPGGNKTGFASSEPTVVGKWLEGLKEMAPKVRRMAVILDQQNPAWIGHMRTIEQLGPSFMVEPSAMPIQDVAEFERAIEAFGHDSNGGLVVLPGPLTARHRERIIAIAARRRMPAVYPFRYFVLNGGLLSYGIETTDLWRRAAGYVDRIIKGEKPGDLPVQQPIKYELVINLKTARALGLDVPPTLLVRADEVIE
jgi:putative ABC transport system substrate-binding protein